MNEIGKIIRGELKIRDALNPKQTLKEKEQREALAKLREKVEDKLAQKSEEVVSSVKKGDKISDSELRVVDVAAKIEESPIIVPITDQNFVAVVNDLADKIDAL